MSDKPVQCSHCHLELPKHSFSKNQLKGHQKCKSCVENSSKQNSTPSSNHQRSILTVGDTVINNSTAAPSVLRLNININELDKNELLSLVNVLTQENIQLKIAVSNLSRENIRLQEENGKLVAQIQSVESLRREVERLEAENEILRKRIEKQTADIARLNHTVDTLNSTVKAHSVQIAHLMKAHWNESKLAIRKLLDDAERMTNKSIFSEAARAYISKHSSKLRQEGDRAAHYFTRERIKVAISEYTVPKSKLILIDLFAKSYGVPFEEEEEVDDSWLSDLDG